MDAVLSTSSITFVDTVTDALSLTVTVTGSVCLCGPGTSADSIPARQIYVVKKMARTTVPSTMTE